ncbi:hypothetical protein KFL_014450015 [Klebsormidium nitens]|uniref:Uncharacterized protein n=1 Tax=Klebsormidium nitens TaxID=105231 RepID=A0A1Y1IUN8_KLENI|nr:hypothetical protein KFL_014450015 [Klebsormidium nitens]|eukprot:GAQ93329.1 hypothetical protein KFL_014450015 [Klebsormidium nitens]
MFHRLRELIRLNKKTENGREIVEKAVFAMKPELRRAVERQTLTWEEEELTRTKLEARCRQIEEALYTREPRRALVKMVKGDLAGKLGGMSLFGASSSWGNERKRESNDSGEAKLKSQSKGERRREKTLRRTLKRRTISEAPLWRGQRPYRERRRISELWRSAMADEGPQLRLARRRSETPPLPCARLARLSASQHEPKRTVCAREVHRRRSSSRESGRRRAPETEGEKESEEEEAPARRRRAARGKEPQAIHEVRFPPAFQS